MDDRERAVVATQVVMALRDHQPKRLDPVIDQLDGTPWDMDVVQVLKAVRHELERQLHAAKPKR
jgi:hypothetical protein